ncbi:MAG: hypothetical protein QGF74_01280 [Candidatus Nanoarchaeia archaeon]|jgi:hypothetical protein|nr:hypothetical protein [Candidatus Nanoarchaeia archaeon]|tara:strand:+ start:10339 stop:10692 length:354 start_codon:yes stop_codon:yes gene_type:complete
MTNLIACLSTGKGTWGHVSRLIQDGEWENIYLITNDFGKENFSNEKKAELIVINPIKPVKELITELETKLKGKTDGEIALNLVSGSGKEHMAILSALLKLGVGVRLVGLTKDGVEEL